TGPVSPRPRLPWRNRVIPRVRSPGGSRTRTTGCRETDFRAEGLTFGLEFRYEPAGASVFDRCRRRAIMPPGNNRAALRGGSMAGNVVEVVFGPDTAARFQVLEVDGDEPIKSFVQRNGLTFKAGRAFYECGRPETVPAHKALVLMDRQTGDYFGGTRARELLGRPGGGAARLNATTLARYAVFVQSSSANRKLARGTRFLYQTEDPGPRTPRPAAPAHDLAGLLRP